MLKAQRLIKSMRSKLQKWSSQLIIGQKCIKKDAACLIKMGAFPLTGVVAYPLPYYPGTSCRPALRAASATSNWSEAQDAVLVVLAELGVGTFLVAVSAFGTFLKRVNRYRHYVTAFRYLRKKTCMLEKKLVYVKKSSKTP